MLMMEFVCYNYCEFQNYYNYCLMNWKFDWKQIGMDNYYHY